VVLDVKSCGSYCQNAECGDDPPVTVRGPDGGPVARLDSGSDGRPRGADDFLSEFGVADPHGPVYYRLNVREPFRRQQRASSNAGAILTGIHRRP